MSDPNSTPGLPRGAPPDVKPPPAPWFPGQLMAAVAGMDMPNKMEGKPGVVQPDDTPNGGGAIVGGSAGGCMCSYPYKKESEWWTVRKLSLFYSILLYTFDDTYFFCLKYIVSVQFRRATRLMEYFTATALHT